MYVLHVHARVKPEFIEAFREATIDNARNSVQEPGVVRFDVYQEKEDPSRFALVEVYRTPEDHPRHRETPHYKRWREGVDDMMAEPRTSAKYTNVFPGDDGGW